MHLEQFKSLLDQVSKILALALAVVDLVAKVVVFDLEEVEHREDLSIVRYKCLSNSV